MSAAIHAGSKFLALILDAAFRSFLLAGFLAVVLAAFRVRAVRAKLLVWRSLLLVAIAMPVLLLLAPAVPVPVPVPGFSQSAVAAPVQTSSFAPAYAPVQALALSDVRIVPKQNSIFAHAEPGFPQAPLPGFSLPPAAQIVSWPLVALCLYLGVTLFFVTRLSIGIFLGNRLASGAQTIRDAHALNLLAAASSASGLSHPPRLAESDALLVPVTLGVRLPAILLPASWRNWEPDELAAVLAHEVSHVARRDSLFQLLALIHRAFFWFSPLSWWLERHFADLAEQASDEAALAGGADRTRYAQALLGFLADLETSPSRVWWHGVAMAKTGQGETRVDRILAWRSPMSGRISKPLVVALVAISLPVVAFSVAARPTAYTPQDVAAPPAPAPPAPPQQLVPPPEAIPEPPAAPVAIPVVPSVAPPAPPVIAQPVPMIPPQAAVTVPAPPQPPQSPAPQAAPPAPPAPIVLPDRDWSGFGAWGWGPQFVIVTKGSDYLVVNGSEEDAGHARALRSKIPGDFIWFEHDGKSYIIRDQALIDRARQIWAQRGDSAKLQQELQAKQQELSQEMQQQVQKKMQEIRVKIPDMTAELQKLQSEIKDLNAKGATLRQLGDLQRQVGQLQQALGEARWNSDMQDISRRAGELGRQLGELGRQMGEIARQEVEQGRQTGEQMRQLFDNAIASGAAKPE